MQDTEKMASDPQSKKSALTLAIENNPCGRCRAAGYPSCKCGGGGGGGGSGGGGKDKDDVTPVLNQAANIANQAAIQKFDEAKKNFMESQLHSDNAINYETGLLSVESDRLRGNLVFRVNPGLSKADMEVAREFIKAVKDEFEEFKNQLIEQGISTKGFVVNMKDNELAIRIPIPKYYDIFIKHLESKNLLPVPNPDRVDKSMLHQYQESKKPFNPNPLSTRLERK